MAFEMIDGYPVIHRGGKAFRVLSPVEMNRRLLNTVDTLQPYLINVSNLLKMAKVTGIHIGRIFCIFYGVDQPMVSEAIQIARFCGTTVEVLFACIADRLPSIPEERMTLDRAWLRPVTVQEAPAPREKTCSLRRNKRRSDAEVRDGA